MLKKIEKLLKIILIGYLLFHFGYTIFIFTQSLFYGFIWLAILVVELIIAFFGIKKSKLCISLLTLYLICQSCLSMFIYIKGIDMDTKNADYVVVLGYALENNTITDTLQMRLDKAVDYAKKNSDSHLVLCGGITGNNKISEAEVMYNYLLGKGVDSSRMTLENKSTDTIENIKNCKQYVDENSKIVVLSSNYHVYRASKICEKAGLEVHTLGSNAPLLLLPNQFLHEKLGFVKMLIFM